MPVVTRYDAQGSAVGQMELPARIFGIKPHKAVVHQALVAQWAAARAGTASTKTRGEVAGSTRKIWRQKGTGRARHGDVRAPIFVGGGVVFGPKPRDYTQRLPKAMRRLAVRSVLSDAVATSRLRVVEGFGVAEGRTREVVAFLERMGLEGRILLIARDEDKLVRRAARNLPQVRVLGPGTLNVADLLWADHILLEQAVIPRIEEVLA
ncbi:MAG: 50S ribosomal protein L4 [Armatimonadetes bacterium]|nr:50S ribosomal protein L4 [Armatimonadota bacterium]MDW8153585.1 50S ribosomal protein L4 [Armatimonadota bacterium]